MKPPTPRFWWESEPLVGFISPWRDPCKRHPLTAAGHAAFEDMQGLLWQQIHAKFRVVSGYRRYDDELEQFAFLVFYHAARSYRPELGNRFSTHLCTALHYQFIEGFKPDSISPRRTDRPPPGVVLPAEVPWEDEYDPADRGPTPDAEVEERDEAAWRRAVLSAALAALDDRGRGVVVAIARDHTLKAIAEHLGLSRERVRQINAKGLAKLKEIVA